MSTERDDDARRRPCGSIPDGTLGSGNVEERVRRLVSDLFGVLPEQAESDLSPDTLPQWDSLKHISMVLAVEQEFGISLTPEEAIDMRTVGLIIEILRERGVE